MSGSGNSKLGNFPTACDRIQARGSNVERTLTSWNVQSRYLVGCCGYKLNTTVTEQRVPEHPSIHSQVTILTDSALHSVLSRVHMLNPRTKKLLIEGRGKYLTSKGVVLDVLPCKHVYRSSAYTSTVSENIANACDSGIPYTTASRPPTPEPSTSSESPDLSSPPQAPTPVMANIEPPAKQGLISKIHIRTVRPVAMHVKGYTKVDPPKSPAYIALEGYASNQDRAATQPYIAAARGVLARDTPSIQELVSYASPINASHIETAAPLRGILYAYPCHPDAWYMDKFDRQFLRGQDVSSRSERRDYIRPIAARDKLEIKVIAVSLPAFSAHLKNLDPLMSNPANGGIPLDNMDAEWTAVPFSSDLVGQPWLMEYLMTFTTSEVWAGRLSTISTSNYKSADGKPHTVYTTGIPLAHQVYIPGPKKLVLVMLDDNTYSRQSTLTLQDGVTLNIYRGCRITDAGTFADMWVNIANSMYALFTDATYSRSAQNMVNCLQYMESYLCTSMAYPLAVSLAAEIACGVPESPMLHGNNDGSYDDQLSGAWTIGEFSLRVRRPRHTTSNMDEGTIEAVKTRLVRCINRYAHDSLSPLQQFAMSNVEASSVNILVGGEYAGTAVFWKSSKPSKTVDQYQCCTANSIYRLLLGHTFIEKNDTIYSFKMPGGLQNMVTMQGMALSLSLGLTLCKGDVSRKSWSGLGCNESPTSQTPVMRYVQDMCAGIVIPLNTDAHIKQAINGVHTIANEIDLFYGTSPTSNDWGMHICMPYPVFLQWANTFSITMTGEYEATDAVVTAEYEGPHLRVEHSNSHVASWLGVPADTFMDIPSLFVDYQ